MNKRIGYRDLYSMYKKAGIVDDLKAAAGNIGKEWNRNPYLRTGVGALAGAGAGGLIGGKTGAGLGAVLGGAGGYLAHGDEEVEPGFWDKYGTGLATVGGIGVGGAGVTYALMRLAKANPRALQVIKNMVAQAKGKAKIGLGRVGKSMQRTGKRMQNNSAYKGWRDSKLAPLKNDQMKARGMRNLADMTELRQGNIW